MVYMFSYDLKNRSPEQHEEDSQKIKKSVEALGIWCKYLTTTYLIKSDYTLQQIQQKLINHMKPNDKMIICKVELPIMGCLLQKERDWINQHIY